MANALYDTGRNAFLTGDIAYLTDDIRVILIDAALYTVNLAVDDFLSDIASGARVGPITGLGGKTAVDGVADANDHTFLLVTGASVEAVVLYKHTGTESTSQLIAYIDTAVGLPVTPSGGDIIVQWDAAADKIFKL